MAGGRPLVVVTEPTSGGVYKTYRAQNDTGFVRYEKLIRPNSVNAWWRALALDGKTYLFGEDNQ